MPVTKRQKLNDNRVTRWPDPKSLLQLSGQTSDSGPHESAAVAKQERLRLIEEKAAHEQNLLLVSSSSSSSRRGVKRTASSREQKSAARKSTSSSSSSSSSSINTGNRSRGGGKFVRKEGYVYKMECRVCDYGTDISLHMKKHKEIHAGVRFQCRECKREYSEKSGLQKHIRTVHEKRKDFECSVCHQKFGTAGNAKEHREAKHEGVRHECPVAACGGKSYTTKTGCVRHIRLEHGGDHSLVPIRRTREELIEASKSSPRTQSASCSSASSSGRARKFVRKEGYTYKFECGACDYGTDKSNTMKRHKDKQHAAARSKGFQCLVCHKEFISPRSLKTHQESVHEGVRYECPMAECGGKSYSTKGDCVRHVRLEHDGDPTVVPIRRSPNQ